MKMSDLLKEDGRIVKGVNTTVDVGPNEIKIQAAKFGNSVSKDGVPPTLSKKVKGKSTNVLFNLGMTESEAPRYTAMEWAIIEGGHTLEPLVEESTPTKSPKQLFSYFNNFVNEAPISSPRPRLRPDNVTTDDPESSLAPTTSLRPQLRPNWEPNNHERLIVNNGKVRGMEDDEIAAMLAQIKVETGNFQYMTELGGEKYFQMYDPQHAPRKAAALGNTEPGDGYKYRGRGYLQITGRYNYEQASKAMPGGYTNFVDNPELVANPQIAVQLAFHYWARRTQPRVSNWDDVRSVTKTINPGLMHLADRQDAYRHYKLAVAMV
jgi:putative chitinase